MEFWFILAVAIISIVSIMVYAGLAVFFPEWVGITGKVALDAEKSHKSSVENADSSDLKNQS